MIIKNLLIIGFISLFTFLTITSINVQDSHSSHEHKRHDHSLMQHKKNESKEDIAFNASSNKVK